MNIQLFEALTDNRFSDAFNFIRKHVEQTGNISSKYKSQLQLLTNSRLRELEENYKYLLKYLLQGFIDESRKNSLDKIKSGLLEFDDIITKQANLVDSSDLYYAVKRFENVKNASLKSRLSEFKNSSDMLLLMPKIQEEDSNIKEERLNLLKEKEETLRNLFNYVWTIFGAENSEYSLLKETLLNSKDFDLKAQLISAIFLGNMSFYDSKSLAILIDFYDSENDPKLAARALTAIYLIICKYPQRIKIDSDIKNRLILWQDNILTYTRLRDIAFNVIKTIETQRISEKVEKELMPELLKHQKDIIDSLKNNKNKLAGDDYNPKWEEALEKSGIEDKLKELTEIQLEGGDFLMLTFKNLKDFSFFREIPNWFLPFTFDNSNFSSFSHLLSSDLRTLFDIKGIICDSDKYSFILSIQRMPESQREILASQMSSQLDQLKESLENKFANENQKDFSSEMELYIKDLYRFFKLNPRKNEFTDIFAIPLTFFETTVLNDILATPEVLNLLSEFYFRKGYYKEAISILEIIENSDLQEPHIWEKIGYSYYRLKNYDKALVWLKKAELFNSEGKWLNKLLAKIYRITKKYDEAAVIYGKLLDKEPENISLLTNLGISLMGAREYEKALPHFYHAQYIDPENKDLWRFIAWNELLAGNYEKSLKFYDMLQDSGEAHSDDFLNLGHLYYLLKDYSKTLENYNKYISLEHGNFSALRESVKKDLPLLKQRGAEEEELLLIVDYLNNNFIF